jgi:hypothetical protein
LTSPLSSASGNMLQINGDSTPKMYSQVFGSRRYNATAPGLELPSRHFNFT